MIDLEFMLPIGGSIKMRFSQTTTLDDVFESISANFHCPRNILIFSFNGEIYHSNSDERNERLIDLGIKNNYIIQISTLYNCGGDSIEFCDVSNGKQELINSNIIYGTPNKGINIYGLCQEKNCIAYNKEVVVPINKKYFDLLSQKHDLKCPKCNNIIIPNTVGFLQCEYKVKGKKMKNFEEFNFKEIADKSGKYYNSKDNINGKAEMVELNFEVTKYL